MVVVDGNWWPFGKELDCYSHIARYTQRECLCDVKKLYLSDKTDQALSKLARKPNSQPK